MYHWQESHSLWPFLISQPFFHSISSNIKTMDNAHWAIEAWRRRLGWSRQLRIQHTTTTPPSYTFISVLLCQDAASDWKQHRIDHVTNHYPFIVLRRTDDLVSKYKRDDNIYGDEDVPVKIIENMSEWFTYILMIILLWIEW